MLFINLKILRAIIDRGDNLKDKQAYKKKFGHFCAQIFPLNFALSLLIYVQKEFHFYLQWF